MTGLHEWLAEKAAGGFYLYIKRLSANDTGATGGHQSGLYIPSPVAEAVLPSICHYRTSLPEAWVHAQVLSHECRNADVRAVYYNSRYFGKSRNEKRITRWGRGSPLQDPDNTGALTLLAFTWEYGADSRQVEVWVCRDPDQETVVEAALGEVTPGTYLHGPSHELLGGLILTPAGAHAARQLPDDWKGRFPSGQEIITYASGYYSRRHGTPDEHLMSRRQTEYEIFLQVEELHVLDIIRQGFGSVDEFIALANSVSNRRKSRAGRSLELHLEQLFMEYGLRHFATQAVTEGNKKPDFLFPSASAYHDAAFPESRLRMLAVKTTCKDRWRQALSEADRIKGIHLFTLQEGVSVAQFLEMQRAGVTLVVPASLHRKYPEAVRAHLLTLGQFISELIRLYPAG